MLLSAILLSSLPMSSAMRPEAAALVGSKDIAQDQRHLLLKKKADGGDPQVTVTVDGVKSTEHDTDIDDSGKITVRVHVHTGGEPCDSDTSSQSTDETAPTETRHDSNVSSGEDGSAANIGEMIGCSKLTLPPLNASALAKAVILPLISDSSGKLCSESVEHAPPELDDSGFIAPGPWYDCLHAAVAWEHEHKEWSRMPEYKEQGPAGMVADLFLHRAEESEFILEECMHRLERKSHKHLPNSTNLVVQARQLNEHKQQQDLIHPPHPAHGKPTDSKPASARVKHLY